MEADGQVLVVDLDAGLVRIDPAGSPTTNQTVVSEGGDIGTPMGAVVFLPEPGAGWLLGSGVALLAALRSRRVRR